MGAVYKNTPAGNNCWEFDGTDDVVHFGNPANLNMGAGDFSISGWFKTAAGGSGHNNGIVYKRKTATAVLAGYVVNVPSGMITFRIADGTNTVYATYDGSYDDNVWHHFVCVADKGVNMKIYVDGALVKTEAETTVGDTDDATTVFCIGASFITPNVYQEFTGRIDAIKVWKGRVLTAGEISNEYNKSKHLYGK